MKLKIAFEDTIDWEHWHHHTEFFISDTSFRDRLAELKSFADVRNIVIQCTECKKFYDVRYQELDCPHEKLIKCKVDKKGQEGCGRRYNPRTQSEICPHNPLRWAKNENK